jgi:predicted secreted protein
MKRIQDVRRGLWAVGLLCAQAWQSPAIAGDRAVLDIIGYSQDLRYFAYEEYGQLDGIGLAYSSVYIVDLSGGDFAGGSPFKAEADEDTQQPVAEMRVKSAEAAKAELARLKIDAPAEIEALSGDGIIGPSATMRFGMPAYGEPGATQGDYTLSLNSFELPLSDICREKIGRPGQGFALSIAGDGPTRELHRDGPLPDWRGCPVGYRLYAVVMPHELGDLSTGVAVVSSYPFDFEGSSRRFVIVPIGEASE